jgi:hypothetical protein
MQSQRFRLDIFLLPVSEGENTWVLASVSRTDQDGVKYGIGRKPHQERNKTNRVKRKPWLLSNKNRKSKSEDRKYHACIIEFQKPTAMLENCWENLVENKYQLATEKIQINFVPHPQRCIEVVLKFSRDQERSRIQEKNSSACMSRSFAAKFARAMRKRKGEKERERERRGEGVLDESRSPSSSPLQ